MKLIYENLELTFEPFRRVFRSLDGRENGCHFYRSCALIIIILCESAHGRMYESIYKQRVNYSAALHAATLKQEIYYPTSTALFDIFCL